MESAPPANEILYSGDVPMVLKHPDREDRHATLTVEMSYGVTQPRNQRVLHVQLTDEANAYLLYTLDISEDEFHALKTEQSLLVDFHTFPSKLVELLRQCQAAANDEHPKFVAVLSTGGAPPGPSASAHILPLGTSGAVTAGGGSFVSSHQSSALSTLAVTTGHTAPTLTVTEINPFRQLCHLSLRFVAGNDQAVKTCALPLPATFTLNDARLNFAAPRPRSPGSDCAGTWRTDWLITRRSLRLRVTSLRCAHASFPRRRSTPRHRLSGCAPPTRCMPERLPRYRLATPI